MQRPLSAVPANGSTIREVDGGRKPPSTTSHSIRARRAGNVPLAHHSFGPPEPEQLSPEERATRQVARTFIRANSYARPVSLSTTITRHMPAAGKTTLAR
jgi:hypothetical protein